MDYTVHLYNLRTYVHIPLVKSGVRYGALSMEEQFHLLCWKTILHVSAAKAAAACTNGIASIDVRQSFVCSLASP